MKYPFLISDNKKINDAYRLAVANLSANILPFKDGVLETEKPVIKLRGSVTLLHGRATRLLTHGTRAGLFVPKRL